MYVCVCIQYVYTHNIIVSSQTVKPLRSAAFWLRRHSEGHLWSHGADQEADETPGEDLPCLSVL